MASTILNGGDDGAPQHADRVHHDYPGDDADAYSVSVAAKHLGLGTTTTWELVRTGKLGSIRVGRRVLVPRVALVAFIRAQLNGAAS